MYAIVDHRDSFTFNLVQLFGAQGVPVCVIGSDAPSLAALEDDPPDALILSPGPGHAGEAQETAACVRHWLGRVPILGVCLGHQILCAALGARLQLAAEPVHGRVRPLCHDGSGLFEGLPSPLEVARYHSWVVASGGLPPELEVNARDSEGQIMAVRHRRHLAYGIQFHPESFMTRHGPELARAFIRRVAGQAYTAPGEVAHG